MPVDNSATCGTRSPIAAGGKQRNLLELSIGYGLILLAVWTPQPWQRVFSGAALAWIMLVVGLSFEGWTEMGLHISGSLRALWVVGLALVLAVAASTLAGRLHTLHLPGGPTMVVKRYWGYAIWAFLQEFLLLDFVLLRSLRLLPDRKAAVMATAGLFAFAHLPNPILTPATLIWGFVACRLFLRYRNVYTLAVAHAILGICIAAAVPGPVTHHMKVGLGYLTYRPPPSAQPNHISCPPKQW
jgi:hypothetical protein